MNKKRGAKRNGPRNKNGDRTKTGNDVRADCCVDGLLEVSGCVRVCCDAGSAIVCVCRCVMVGVCVFLLWTCGLDTDVGPK